MSDVIARMRLESQDFDSKLKSATANLQHMEREVRRTGATFEYADKEELAFLQSLGQMETKAMDAKGKIKELSNSYKELAMLYERMTDAEKASKPGQALAASLQQLKGRLNDTKQSFASVSAEIGEGGGGLGKVMESLGNKIGIPAGAFTTLGGAIAAAGAAIKLATDAFKQNEELLDDWKATVAGAQSIYESFLVSLNTGDFSGFLRRMSNVSRAAMEAYAALDKLGTFNAFNQINLQRAQTQFTEAVASYREGTGSKSEVRAAADAWKNELETRRKMEQEAYLAKIREIAASRGVDADLLTKALSGNYGDYETLKATQMPTKSVYNSATRSFNDVIDNDAATEVQKLGQALRQLNDTQLQEIQALGRQAQATATEIAQVDRQTVRMLGKSGVGGGASAVTPTAATDAATMTYAEDSIKAQEAEVARLTDLWKNASAELRDGYKVQLDDAKRVLDQMVNSAQQMPTELNPTMNGPERSQLDLLKMSILGQQADQSAAIDENTLKSLLGVALQNGIDGLDLDFSRIMDDMREGLDIPPETWKALEAKINEKLKELKLDPIKLNVETGGLDNANNKVKDTTKAWQVAASAVSTVGSALQQIEDPAAKVAGIVAQAIAQIALTFAMSLKGTVTPWDWIAAAVAGTSTMISTIAAIKSVTNAKGYAEGGMVEGTSYSGDNIVARLNAGEGVLTARGVENAESMAAAIANPFGNLQLSTKLTGTELLILLNNTNRSLGGSRNFYSERH